MINPKFIIGMTSVEVLVEIIRVNLKRGFPGFKNEFIWFHKYVPRKNTQDMKNKSLLRPSFHDFSKSSRAGVKSELITVDYLNRWINLLEKNEALGIISELKISYSFTEIYPYHIPMMDFRCPKSLENLLHIKELLRTIGQEEGVILDSGRSYHYYGANLIDERHWWSFQENCLSSELNLADKRYIDHRFKDSCSILRLSASPLRPKIPRVVVIL